MFNELGTVMKLLGNKDKIAGEFAKLQAAVAALAVDGTDPAGLVAVKMSGKMEVLSLTVADAGLADRAGLERAVTLAVNQATAAARDRLAAETRKMAESVGLPPAMLAAIPGLG